MLIPDDVEPRERLREERRAERERQEPVRDRGAERPVGRARRIDVDPLVVTRRVCERVDALLGDLEPLGRLELLADQIA